MRTGCYDYKDGHSRLLKRSNYDMSKVSVIDSCRNTYSEVDALMKRLSSQKEELHVGLVSVLTTCEESR